MNLTAVLLTGLLAGGVSCAAVQGGLLAGLITCQRQAIRALVVSGSQPSGTAPDGHSPRATLADDLTPVGAFLTGKLLSHTLLGALLGALGTAVQLSVRAHTAVQLGAGALIIAFGLAQLGVPGFRGFVVEPPLSFGRLVLHSARARTAFAPALLGLVSVLIPCGVTLSVEALALTSGSAAAGAATMTVFVIKLDIHGMHCGSCALLIDDTLADLPGVITSQTSHKHARATLTIDPTRIDHTQIVTAIQGLGYQTDRS